MRRSFVKPRKNCTVASKELYNVNARTRDPIPVARVYKLMDIILSKKRKTIILTILLLLFTRRVEILLKKNIN